MNDDEDSSKAKSYSSHDWPNTAAITIAQQQYLPCALICIYTTSIDAVCEEEDLQEKPLWDLITKLQEDNPFVAKKWAALQAWLTHQKDQVTEQGQWHFREDGLLYHLYRLYIPDNEAL